MGTEERKDGLQPHYKSHALQTREDFHKVLAGKHLHSDSKAHAPASRYSRASHTLPTQRPPHTALSR